MGLTGRQDDDLRVIGQVRRGQRDAFAALVRRYQRPVLRLARNILGDPHEAEDVAQEAFVDAYRHLDTFDGRAAFSTWLLAIARNRCLSALRKKRPIPVADVPEITDDTRPEDNASAAETQDRLDAALDRLPDDQNRAFVLVVFVGLTPTEAAHVEGVPPGTLRSRLSRARQFLRGALKGRPGDRP